MFRKIISIVSVCLLLCSAGAAEDYCFDTMTEAELRALIQHAEAELQRREEYAREDVANLNLAGQAYTVEELAHVCAAIKDEAERRGAFNEFEVPVGTWEVGKHLSAGTYAIRPQSGSGTVYLDVTSSRLKSKLSVSGECESGWFRHIELIKGDSIEIKYNKVVFSPAELYPVFAGADHQQSPIDVSGYSDAALQQTYAEIVKQLADAQVPEITIPSGVWVVGEHIPAGTYDIVAFVNEDTGNYSFYLCNGLADVAKYGGSMSLHGFGKKYDTSAASITLKEGNALLLDGCMVRLTKASQNLFFGP